MDKIVYAIPGAMWAFVKHPIRVGGFALLLVWKGR